MGKTKKIKTIILFGKIVTKSFGENLLVIGLNTLDFPGIINEGFDFKESTNSFSHSPSTK